MASPRRSKPHKILETLQYFDKYDYPLTKSELHHWAGNTLLTGIASTSGYYHLPKRGKIAVLRKRREEISKEKWRIAEKVGDQLKKFHTIQAIFVTGSLAMNNASTEDDIDLMIVTSANTLWLTRFFVVLYLKLLGIRRHLPDHRTPVTEHANRVCDNLWLDENHLHIPRHDLYTAHEILQAKVLWEGENVSGRFLSANSWVKEFLPHAYKKENHLLDQLEIRSIRNLWAAPINLFFYWLQYLYMKSRMTSERVTLGSAFFHPTKS